MKSCAQHHEGKGAKCFERRAIGKPETGDRGNTPQGGANEVEDWRIRRKQPCETTWSVP